MISNNRVAITWQIHLGLLCISLLLIVIPAFNKLPSQQVAEKSLVAATEFLFLVDTEEYAKSWHVTADAMKDMLTQKAWNKKIEELRGYLGPAIERIRHRITYTASASNVPEGEYVVMTFITRFASRPQVIETLTLMLGADNEWRVAGYYLR